MTSLTVYTSKPEAFLVNSFLIDVGTGLVIIDTQFLVTPARELRQMIDETGKPLLGVVITHPHPDHFNGTKIVLEGKGGVPIYASEATAQVIRPVDTTKRAYWSPIHGAEYPSETLFPTHVVQAGQALRIGRMDFILDDLGPAETSNNAVIYLPQDRILIASDFVYNRVHPWLAEGHSAEWIEKLKKIRCLYPDATRLYPGHGEPGGWETLDHQAAYLEFFRKQVSQALADGPLSPSSKKTIVDATATQFPGFALDFLIPLNIDGVALELTSK